MVQITSLKKGKRAIMTFTNDAQDINQENVKLLFNNFFTISQSRSKKNTGLGLAITKELVEKMNGDIEAKYSEGYFTLIVSFPTIFCRF